MKKRFTCFLFHALVMLAGVLATSASSGMLEKGRMSCEKEYSSLAIAEEGTENSIFFLASGTANSYGTPVSKQNFKTGSGTVSLPFGSMAIARTIVGTAGTEVESDNSHGIRELIFPTHFFW